jgi:hypothetical protein
LRETASLVDPQGLELDPHADCAPVARSSLKLYALDAAGHVEWLFPVGGIEGECDLRPKLQQEIGLDPETLFAHVGYLVRNRFAPEL